MIFLAATLAVAYLVNSIVSREELAREILKAAARDQNKEACVHVSDDSVCTLPDGHKGEHRYERVSSVVPFE